MKKRYLGQAKVEVSAIGLGCMGMSPQYYGGADEVESLATLHHALDNGLSFWDTSDVYGAGHNEQLLATVLKDRRSEVVLATKFGFVLDEQRTLVGINGQAAYVKQACDASLQRLGVDHIDLYYLHRVDTNTPIEETVGAMAELVQAGKVRYIGLSETSAETLRRAHAVHPITALQSEYSLWSRDIEAEILPTCRELGITLVPYSPLGRGFLTGQIKTFEDFAPHDYRRQLPRFQGENFQKNLDIVHELEKMATEKGATASQLALAWVLAQGDDIVPIPGTTRRKNLQENRQAAEIALTQDELARINRIGEQIVGDRYHELGMQYTNM